MPRAVGQAIRALVVMGVAGSGKSTVAAMMAGRLGWAFRDADDFHPPENVAKMSAGVPLTDEDRKPWLAAIAAWIDARRAQGGSAGPSATRTIFIRRRMSRKCRPAFR